MLSLPEAPGLPAPTQGLSWTSQPGEAGALLGAGGGLGGRRGRCAQSPEGKVGSEAVAPLDHGCRRLGPEQG